MNLFTIDEQNEMLQLLSKEQRENLENAITSGVIHKQDFLDQWIQEFIPAIILGYFPVVAYFKNAQGNLPEWLPLKFRDKEITHEQYRQITRLHAAINGLDVNREIRIKGDFIPTGTPINTNN